MNESKSNHISRRSLLSALTTGAAGLIVPSLGLSGCATGLKSAPKAARTFTTDPGEAQVSVVTGDSRRQLIRDALAPHSEQLANEIQGKQVVIKINCVMHGNPLIATHPDAVRGVLDVLKPIYDGDVWVAESTASPNGTYYTFEEYGYLPLEEEYNVKLVELNNEPTVERWIVDRDMYPHKIRVISTFTDPNYYIISVTRLKTHNCVVATLSLKNVVMGSPLKIPAQKINDKAKMHGYSIKSNEGRGRISTKFINFNLFRLAHHVHPDLSVLDGFEGVEGNGPTEGEPVDHHVAVAGFDYVAVDRIGTELMGIPWENVGYLNYCATAGLGQGDRDRIAIIGENPTPLAREYKLHENIDWQMEWDDDLLIKEKG